MLLQILQIIKSFCDEVVGILAKADLVQPIAYVRPDLHDRHAPSRDRVVKRKLLTIQPAALCVVSIADSLHICAGRTRGKLSRKQASRKQAKSAYDGRPGARTGARGAGGARTGVGV